MIEDAGFVVADYVVCAIVISISISIGLYYAFSGGKQKTTLEYHLGNRQLRVIPVMLSLMVSSQSSILLIGVPAEMYVFGIMAAFVGLGFSIAYLLASRIIIPLVYPLKITSVNEYFELRYRNRYVRYFMTFLGAFFWIVYSGIITFGLAIAIESVVGIPVWMCIVAVSISSTLYTSIGGIKAVVWTDVFQYLIMMAGVIAVLIKGSYIVGGGSKVLQLNRDGGRLDKINFSLDPTARYTVWNILIGSTLKVIAFPLSQSAVQRIGCMPTIDHAYRMFYIIAPFILVTFSLAAAQGFVAYAYYHSIACDPLASKSIFNPNQIVPYMVVHLFKTLPGMSGVFISALFCATLSSLSSGFAALSSMTLEDIIKQRFKNLTEFKATVISKFTVVFYGLVTTGVSFLIANVKGTLLELASVLLSIPMAPYTGVFLYSIFYSRATTAGALSGGIVSLLFYIWLSMGQKFSNLPKKNDLLPFAPTDGCSSFNSSDAISLNTTSTSFFNATTVSSVVDAVQTLNEPEGISKLYLLSFQWFDLCAIIIAIVIGIIVSVIVGRPDPESVDVRYVLSFPEQFFPFLPKKIKHLMTCGSNIGERRKKYLEEEEIKKDNAEMCLDLLDASNKEKMNSNDGHNEKI